MTFLQCSKMTQTQMLTMMATLWQWELPNEFSIRARPPSPCIVQSSNMKTLLIRWTSWIETKLTSKTWSIGHGLTSLRKWVTRSVQRSRRILRSQICPLWGFWQNRWDMRINNFIYHQIIRMAKINSILEKAHLPSAWRNQPNRESTTKLWPPRPRRT